MQDNILEKNPSSQVRVYAVWFPMISTDSRSRWGWTAGVLNDPRVVHIWDENKVVGRWFSKQLDHKDYDGEVLWDAYLLYGPEARWDSAPAPLIGWGTTINNTRAEFEKSISSVLAAKKN